MSETNETATPAPENNNASEDAAVLAQLGLGGSTDETPKDSGESEEQETGEETNDQSVPASGKTIPGSDEEETQETGEETGEEQEQEQGATYSEEDINNIAAIINNDGTIPDGTDPVLVQLATMKAQVLAQEAMTDFYKKQIDPKSLLTKDELSEVERIGQEDSAVAAATKFNEYVAEAQKKLEESDKFKQAKQGSDKVVAIKAFHAANPHVTNRMLRRDLPKGLYDDLKEGKISVEDFFNKATDHFKNAKPENLKKSAVKAPPKIHKPKTAAVDTSKKDEFGDLRKQLGV